MQLQVVPVTPFQQNCSVVWCGRTRAAAIVDPGGDLESVLTVVSANALELQKILLTHAHIDHAGATAELARRKSLPIEGPHPDDRFGIEALSERAAMFALKPAEVFEPDRWLGQGDRLEMGDLTLQVRHCPGHTPGHVVFFNEPARFAIVADGENLFPLGDDVRYLPGHGPMSTFGAERRSNPFVADHLFAPSRAQEREA